MESRQFDHFIVTLIMSLLVMANAAQAQWTTPGPSVLNLNGKMFTMSLNGGGISFYSPYYNPFSTTYAPRRTTTPYTTNDPWRTTTNNPWRTTTNNPWRTTTNNPWRTTTKPWRTTTKPWRTTTNPWRTTTNPWRTTTNPWRTTTKPWRTTTNDPWRTTTNNPWRTTTNNPWRTTTNNPWRTTTTPTTAPTTTTPTTTTPTTTTPTTTTPTTTTPTTTTRTTTRATTTTTWTTTPSTTGSPSRGVSVCLRYITDFLQTQSPPIFTLSPSSTPLKLIARYPGNYQLMINSYYNVFLTPNLKFLPIGESNIWTSICLTVDTRKNVAQVFSRSNMSMRKLLPYQYMWSGEPVIDFSGFDGQLTDVQVWDYPLMYKEVWSYMMQGVFGSQQGSVLTWSYIGFRMRGNTLMEDTYEVQAKQPMRRRGAGRYLKGKEVFRMMGESRDTNRQMV